MQNTRTEQRERGVGGGKPIKQTKHPITAAASDDITNIYYWADESVLETANTRREDTVKLEALDWWMEM